MPSSLGYCCSFTQTPSRCGIHPLSYRCSTKKVSGIFYR